MTARIRPAGVVGLIPKSVAQGGSQIIQGPPAPSKNLSFDAEMVYASIIRRVHRVVKRAGRMAYASARERAPVRKIFKGGRRTKPRFYTLSEARTELPAFLRSMGQDPSGRARQGQMTKAQALRQLRATPISTSRNRANSWQRTGQKPHRTIAARDDLGNPRKDEHGNSLFAAMRDIEYQGGRDRLFDRSAEKQLTSQGRYELKVGRAISFGTGAKARHKFKSEAELEAWRRSFETRDAQGRVISAPGSEGQLGGNLRRSIDLAERSTGDKPKVSIVAGGEDAPYARFVEFGTRHAAAQPFLRPALKHVEGPYKAMMREEFPGSR